MFIYLRRELQKCASKFISTDDVPKESIISLTETVAKQSLKSSQGYNKCNCRASAKQICVIAINLEFYVVLGVI